MSEYLPRAGVEVCPMLEGVPRPTPVEVVRGARAMLGRSQMAYADCQRCGAPAHPIRGYCGRFCEEAARYEAERHERETWTLHCHKPGSRVPILNLDPPTPEETRDAFAEAYAALERDVRRAFYLGEPQPVDPLATWLDDPRTFGGKP